MTNRFIWTTEDYTCEQLRDQFNNKFPVIALVTIGYYGDKDHEFISADTIVRIHNWGAQQRIVAKDHRGRYITIPVNYPIKIQQLLKTLEPVGNYVKIQEFLNNNILPKTAQLDKSEVERLYAGDRLEMFGILEVIHVYNEKFFKANVFRAGNLVTDSTYMLPMHIGMRFKVALGLKASSADDWTRYLSEVNDEATKVDFSSLLGIPDIFVYKRQAASWDFNNEMPIYHVRHPLTLRKGMDRDSWNMCVTTGRNTLARTPSKRDDSPDMKFNQTTGMKQPTMSAAVHKELLAKLGNAPKRTDLVTKPGDFADRHRMLQAIFQPAEQALPPENRTRADVQPKKAVPEQEQDNSSNSSSSDYYDSGPIKAMVAEHPTTHRQSRPISGEYDPALIPQQDNGVYGSHDPARLRAGHPKKDPEAPSNEFPGYRAPPKVKNPNEYLYNGRPVDSVPTRGGHRHRRGGSGGPPPRRDDSFFRPVGKSRTDLRRLDVAFDPLSGRPFRDPPAYHTLFHSNREVNRERDPFFNRDPVLGESTQDRSPPRNAPREPVFSDVPQNSNQRFQSRRVGHPEDYDYNTGTRGRARTHEPRKHHPPPGAHRRDRDGRHHRDTRR